MKLKRWEVSMANGADTAPEAAPSGAQPGVFNDPYRAYNFNLVIQGVTEGHFTACSGPGIKVQVIKHRGGGASQVVHFLPGPREKADINLRLRFAAPLEILAWPTRPLSGH